MICGRWADWTYCTVNTALLLTLPIVAVIVTVCGLTTRVVGIEKIALVVPCGTITNPGTCAIKSTLL